MNEEDEALLKREGWTVECEGPFEIRHEDGSQATGQAANMVLDTLRSDQRVGTCSLCYCAIYGYHGRFVDESSDGQKKMYHDICKVSMRANEAERKLNEHRNQRNDDLSPV